VQLDAHIEQRNPFFTVELSLLEARQARLSMPRSVSVD
jgi:hypothetical protein